MAEILQLKIKNIDKVFSNIRLQNKRFFQRVRGLWSKDGRIVIRKLVTKFYSGQSTTSLGKRTGTLSKAFRSETKRATGTINVIQKIFIDPSSPANLYVATHDASRNFNGTIRPKSQPRLVFKGDHDLKIVKTKKVFIPIRTNVIPFLENEMSNQAINSVNLALKTFG